jgi:hypothetical protein
VAQVLACTHAMQAAQGAPHLPLGDAVRQQSIVPCFVAQTERGKMPFPDALAACVHPVVPAQRQGAARPAAGMVADNLLVLPYFDMRKGDLATTTRRRT